MMCKMSLNNSVLLVSNDACMTFIIFIVIGSGMHILNGNVK